jgi:integrase
MDVITLQDVNAFKQARLSEVSRTTCRDEIMMIRRVFRWYIIEHHAKTGEMLINPCELLTMPKANKPRDRVVTRKELELLLGAMTPQMAVIVELAYETAMRRGELLKLTPRDLHLEDRFLRVVDGKEGSRDVPLTRRAVELLEGALEGLAMRDARIFPMAPYSVTQAVRRSREAVGLGRDVRFHQLRHSRITEVARMGLNQLQIMIVSGHRDIRSVQRYTHLNVRDVVNLID